jgi:hypothetical protein
MIIKY